MVMDTIGHRMTRLVTAVCATLLALGTASACAGGSGSPGSGNGMNTSVPGGTPSAGPAGSSTGGAPTGGSTSGSVPPSTGGSPVPGEQTLRGQVMAGVERGCLLLTFDGVDYLLLGGDPRVVYEGASISVRGSVNRGVMTTCMQGVPFRVAEAHPA